MSKTREYFTQGSYLHKEPGSDWTPYTWSLPNTEQLLVGDVSHFPLNTGIDDGGPFYCVKHNEFVSGHSIDEFNSFTGRGYRGPICLTGSSGWGGYPSFDYSPLSELDLTTSGTTMMSRSLPTNPAFDAATAIGEAREGVPSIVGIKALRDRTNLAKKAGDEYLNVEFGWKPLVRDVQDLARAVQSSHDIWSNYRKGSDKKTRVGYHLTDDSVTKTRDGILFTNTGQSFRNFQGSMTYTRYHHTWFRGCFRYYVPEPKGLAGKWGYWKSQASKILGVRLTPATLWNLSPWTWGVDWFTNAGDVLHNISQLGNDGLVMQYGYAMDDDFSITIREAEGHARKSTSRYMRRVAATPYGFGVNLSTLSGRQISIIAALGLSRT